MIKKILSYQDQLDRDWKPQRTIASQKKVTPEIINKWVDDGPCDTWVRLQPFDENSGCVVYAFYPEGLKDED